MCDSVIIGNFLYLFSDSDAVNEVDSVESKGLSCAKNRPFKEFQVDEESVSSDSAGSGRVKKQFQKKPLAKEVSGEDSPRRYNVSKLSSPTKEQCSKTSLQRSSMESHHPVIFRQVPSASYKRKNAENTIYQMAFRKSRNRFLRKSKDHESIDRNVCEELRLQKSLSEECEDLGVDEPSTSDLFPEAELLIDPDPSSRDSHSELPKNKKSDSSSSSTPVNGGSADCNDEAEVLGWDEEESVCLLPLQEDSSGQNIPNSSNSPPFLTLSNPAASAPYTYSNKSHFKLSQKRKLEISWERVLKKRSEKDEADSDGSEIHMSEYGKCAVSTTDEDVFSEGEYQSIPVRYSSESLSNSAEYLGDRGSSSVKHTSKLSSLKSLAKGNSDSSPSPPPVSAEISCTEDRLPGFSLSRRSSLRGHIKKGCPCCNGSPERPKKKKDRDGSLNPDKVVENLSSCSKKNKNVLKSYSVKKR